MSSVQEEFVSSVVGARWTLAELAADLEQSPRGRFAILDACDEPRIPAKVRMLEDRAVSLYRGWAEEDFWAIAPYVAVLDAALLDWITGELGETPWGVVVAADLDLEGLRKHLRRFLLVQGPANRQLYFRFYDPRVLPDYLATC